MNTLILIVNIGSASKKYSLFDGVEEEMFFHFEKEGDNFLLTIKGKGKFEKTNISRDDYENSLEFLNNYFADELGVGEKDIIAVSFRVVSPGTYFTEDRKINDEYMDKLAEAEILDKLHISPVITEIKKTQKVFVDKELFAISDSAFHKNKLEEAKYYGISKKLQDEKDLKRFGYHGISVQSIWEKMKEKEDGLEDKKILVCHLGGGISFTALKNGKSLDNSMGFSPLEGPMMATRSGNLDDVLLEELFEVKNLKTRDEKIEFLSNQSGLLGLSGFSSDLRVLRDEVFKGNKDAQFSVKVYVYNLVKEITKMISVLKGVDILVFSGTIGYRADFMREAIIDELVWLGLKLDLDDNTSNNINSDYYYVNSHDSSAKILVCKTDEMTQMARNTLKIM
jgi:acetate kinase